MMAKVISFQQISLLYKASEDFLKTAATRMSLTTAADAGKISFSNQLLKVFNLLNDFLMDYLI